MAGYIIGDSEVTDPVEDRRHAQQTNEFGWFNFARVKRMVLIESVVKRIIASFTFFSTMLCLTQMRRNHVES